MVFYALIDNEIISGHLMFPYCLNNSYLHGSSEFQVFDITIHYSATEWKIIAHMLDYLQKLSASLIIISSISITFHPYA